MGDQGDYLVWLKSDQLNLLGTCKIQYQIYNILYYTILSLYYLYLSLQYTTYMDSSVNYHVNWA